MRSRQLSHSLPLVLAPALLVLAPACGGNYSQPDARDRATAASCDWYEACGEIGEDKAYASRDACEVDVRAYWNNAWPVELCDQKIPPEKMDTCLVAIEITECGNAFDFLNTVANKCGRANMCTGDE